MRRTVILVFLGVSARVHPLHRLKFSTAVFILVVFLLSVDLPVPVWTNTDKY